MNSFFWRYIDPALFLFIAFIQVRVLLSMRRVFKLHAALIKLKDDEIASLKARQRLNAGIPQNGHQ